MDYYTDIKLKSNKEIWGNVLLNKVYGKLHIALVSLDSNDIAVSFPKKNITPGNVIRIHSAEERLRELFKLNFLNDYKEYCLIADIKKIPKEVKYQIISRKKLSMSMSKLRTRHPSINNSALATPCRGGARVSYRVGPRVVKSGLNCAVT